MFIMIAGKTFAVCASIIMMLPENEGFDKGIITVLCLGMFVSQTIIDSLLVNYYKKHNDNNKL